MIGVAVCIIAIIALMMVCSTITTEHFDKALMKQAEEWEN